MVNTSQLFFRHSTIGGLRDEPYRPTVAGLGHRLRSRGNRRSQGLRRLRAARSFHAGAAGVRAGLLLLGPEPQVHSAGSRVCHLVWARNGRLGSVGVADLEGDTGAGAHLRYSPDRGGSGGPQRRLQPLRNSIRRSLFTQRRRRGFTKKFEHLRSILPARLKFPSPEGTGKQSVSGTRREGGRRRDGSTDDAKKEPQ